MTRTAWRRYGSQMVPTLIGMWLCLAALATAASVEYSTEYSVKAAFLCKFGAFMEWSADTFPSANAPFVIAIVGDDPFGAALDDVMKGQTVEGRAIVALRSQQIEKIQGENVLFISQSEKSRMGPIIAHLQGKKIVTVAEFDDPHIILQFVLENDKVRFDVNLAQANRIGIKPNSKLLSVARSITRK